MTMWRIRANDVSKDIGKEIGKRKRNYIYKESWNKKPSLTCISISISIHRVYDVSKYINHHPGGRGTLLAYGGKDATKAFLDQGHSDW